MRTIDRVCRLLVLCFPAVCFGVLTTIAMGGISMCAADLTWRAFGVCFGGGTVFTALVSLAWPQRWPIAALPFSVPASFGFLTAWFDPLLRPIAVSLCIAGSFLVAFITSRLVSRFRQNGFGA